MKQFLRVMLVTAAARLLTIALVASCLAIFTAQGQSSKSSSINSPYITQIHVPAPVRSYLLAFGDRIQRSGKERTTLTGTYTDQNGSTAAQLVWQVPGEIRFDRANQPGMPLIYETTGLVNSGSVSPADANVLESLFSDAVESFLYGFQGTTSYRLLGTFRSDDGKTPNFSGPWYEIYDAIEPVPVQLGNPTREKTYLFNSQTKFLESTQYVLSQGSSNVNVTTQFSGWTTTAGQSFPGQIIRKENGVTIFTFNISGTTVGPSANDGLFP